MAHNRCSAETSQVTVDLLRVAIADGFSNGKQQYEDCDTAQQRRFDDAARAVLALSQSKRP